MELLLHPDVTSTIARIVKGKHSDPVRAKKIRNTLERLAADHRHPSLASHRYETWDKAWGAPVWESYVEQGTPSAWRIWWYFGPGDGQITVIAIGPHP